MCEMYPVQMALSANEIESTFGSLFDLSSFLIGRTYVSELSGGLTNQNIYVETATGKYVARISSNESDYLAIDRGSEFENSKLAAKAGIGAPVFDFFPGKGLLVIGFLPGETLSAEEVDKNLKRVARSCQTLHSSDPFIREFNMFKIQRNYLQIVLEKEFRLPSDYQDLTIEISKLEAVLKQNAQPLVSCNNDLLPGNFIDDGEKIWLIDYEYSGNNDRCFELGNIWSEAMLPLDSLEELVRHYFEADRPEQFARAWLYAVFAKYSWTLWASIQESISAIEFDFWSWGIQKYEDSRSLFASPLYKKMIEQATKK